MPYFDRSTACILSNCLLTTFFVVLHFSWKCDIIIIIKNIFNRSVEIPRLQGNEDRCIRDLSLVEQTLSGDTEQEVQRLKWEARIRFAHSKARFIDLMVADGFYTGLLEYTLPGNSNVLFKVSLISQLEVLFSANMKATYVGR